MNARALGMPSLSVAPAGSVSYGVAYVALALGTAALAATGAANDATLALDRFIAASLANGGMTHLGTETFTASGASTGAAGWLGAFVTAALGGGLPGMLGAALAAFVVFALVERRASRMAGPALGLAAAALAMLCSLGSFGAGAGIVTAAFALGLVEVIELPGFASPLGATLLAIVWCNVAPQGVLAPMIALVCALGSTFEGADPSERRARYLAVAGTLLALVLTPGLLAYPAIAYEELRVDRALDGIVAYHPVDTLPLAYRTGFLLAGWAAFAFGLRRERAGDLVMYLFAGWLAWSSGAYLPVFGALVAPLLAASAAQRFPQLGGGARVNAGVMLAAGAAALMLAGALAPRELRTQPGPAYALAASLAADGNAHRVFCSNVDWCDAALGGRTRVFMDGRVGAYPAAVRSEQHDIVRLADHWRRTLDARGVDAMLVRRARPLAGLIALTPGWHEVARDSEAVLFERRTVAR